MSSFLLQPILRWSLTFIVHSLYNMFLGSTLTYM
jgi:hypothetical protein